MFGINNSAKQIQIRMQPSVACKILLKNGNKQNIYND